VLAAELGEWLRERQRPLRLREAIPQRGLTTMGDKGPGSKGGGKKPKTSTKKKGAATK
jgi:hypothetical protein